MARLIHEIWEEPEPGGPRHSCCLAGPMGDAARTLLAPGATLLTTFEAGSHVEAMTLYNQFLAREPYTTDHAADHAPYPDAWAALQSPA